MEIQHGLSGLHPVPGLLPEHDAGCRVDGRVLAVPSRAQHHGRAADRLRVYADDEARTGRVDGPRRLGRRQAVRIIDDAGVAALPRNPVAPAAAPAETPPPG